MLKTEDKLAKNLSVDGSTSQAFDQFIGDTTEELQKLKNEKFTASIIVQQMSQEIEN